MKGVFRRLYVVFAYLVTTPLFVIPMILFPVFGIVGVFLFIAGVEDDMVYSFIFFPFIVVMFLPVLLVEGWREYKEIVNYY